MSGTSLYSRGSTRGRGRPSGNSNSSRGRPRSRGRQSGIQSGMQGSIRNQSSFEKMSTRSSHSDSIDPPFDISSLRAERHQNGKPKYGNQWLHHLLVALDHDISPNGLLQIIESLKQHNPIFQEMDVPSCSYVKSLRLSIDPLNTLQANVFLNDHDDFILTFDESPSRFVQNHIDLRNNSFFSVIKKYWLLVLTVKTVISMFLVVLSVLEIKGKMYGPMFKKCLANMKWAEYFAKQQVRMSQHF